MTTITDAEIKRIAAEVIAGVLEGLKRQADHNDLPYLANLLGRALEEAREQSKDESAGR